MYRNFSMSMSSGDLLVFKVGRLVFKGPQGLEMAVLRRHHGLLLIGEESITWFQRLHLIHSLVARS